MRTSWLVLILFFGGCAMNASDLEHPRLEVYKATRQLQLFDGLKLIKTYRIALGSNPIPRKEREGDMATPEGSYFICHKNSHSKYHLSLAISYPGPVDAARGLLTGLISVEEYQAVLEAYARRATPPWKTRLGGEVFVHGEGSSSDWTWGCVALENAEMDELFRLVPEQTPINIHP